MALTLFHVQDGKRNGIKAVKGSSYKKSKMTECQGEIFKKLSKLPPKKVTLVIDVGS